MKHKVADLEGTLLDAAVAKAEGLSIVPASTSVCHVLKNGHPFRFSPSADWQQGGPLIERERIVVWPSTHSAEPKRWCALHPARPDGGYFDDEMGTVDVRSYDGSRGPTPLIAAMRAFVASKLGDEVELP